VDNLRPTPEICPCVVASRAAASHSDQWYYDLVLDRAICGYCCVSLLASIPTHSIRSVLAFNNIAQTNYPTLPISISN